MWLTYASSINTPVAAWYQTVESRRSTDATFFAMGGHAFGYIGLQQMYENPFEGNVIFSIWDRGEGHRDDAEVLERGDNVVRTSFDGEGAGAKACIDFQEWQFMSITLSRVLTRRRAEGCDTRDTSSPKSSVAGSC